MSIRPYRDIMRRKSRRIMVGSVPVGGDSPITVQTMTNTLTAGNAGGLDVLVDGAPTPSLGAVGLVKRDLPLDPAGLKTTNGH